MANSILQGNMPFDRSIYSKAEVDRIVEEHSHYIVSPAGSTYIRPTDEGNGVIDRTIEVNKYLSITFGVDPTTGKATIEGFIPAHDGVPKEIVWTWTAPDAPVGGNYVMDLVGPFTSKDGSQVYVPSTSPVHDGFDPEAFYANLWGEIVEEETGIEISIPAGTECLVARSSGYDTRVVYDSDFVIECNDLTGSETIVETQGKVFFVSFNKDTGVGQMRDSSGPEFDLQYVDGNIVVRGTRYSDTSYTKIVPADAITAIMLIDGPDLRIRYKNFPQWFTFDDRGNFEGHDAEMAEGSCQGVYYEDTPSEVISDSRVIATLDDITEVVGVKYATQSPLGESDPVDNVVTVFHMPSGVAAGSYGEESDMTVAPGESFVVTKNGVNATGHVTDESEVSITLDVSAGNVMMGYDSNDRTVSEVIEEIQEEIGGGGGSSITERLDKLDAEVADLSNDLVDLSNDINSRLDDLSNDINSRLDDLSNDLATHEHSYIVNGSTKVQANDDGTASIVDSLGQKGLYVPEDFTFRRVAPDDTGLVSFEGPYEKNGRWYWFPPGVDPDTFNPPGQPAGNHVILGGENSTEPIYVLFGGFFPMYSISGWNSDQTVLDRTDVGDMYVGDISVAEVSSKKTVATVDQIPTDVVSHRELEDGLYEKVSQNGYKMSIAQDGTVTVSGCEYRSQASSVSPFSGTYCVVETERSFYENVNNPGRIDFRIFRSSDNSLAYYARRDGSVWTVATNELSSDASGFVPDKGSLTFVFHDQQDPADRFLHVYANNGGVVMEPWSGFTPMSASRTKTLATTDDVASVVSSAKSELDSRIDDLSNDVNSRLDDLSNDIDEVIDTKLTEIEGKIDDLSNDVYSAIDDLSNDLASHTHDRLVSEYKDTRVIAAGNGAAYIEQDELGALIVNLTAGTFTGYGTLTLPDDVVVDMTGAARVDNKYVRTIDGIDYWYVFDGNPEHGRQFVVDHYYEFDITNWESRTPSITFNDAHASYTGTATASRLHTIEKRIATTDQIQHVDIVSPTTDGSGSGKAADANATGLALELTQVFSEWTPVPNTYNGLPVFIAKDDGKWAPWVKEGEQGPYRKIGTDIDDSGQLHLEWPDGYAAIPLVADRSVIGYTLGDQDTKQLAAVSVNDRVDDLSEDVSSLDSKIDDLSNDVHSMHSDRIVSQDGNTVVTATDNKTATISYPTGTVTSVFFPEGFSITSSGATYTAPSGGEMVTFKGPYRMIDSSGYPGGYIWYPTNLPNDPEEGINPSSYNPWRWFIFGDSSNNATYLLWGGNFGFSITNWGSEHPTLAADQYSETSGDLPVMTIAGSDFVTKNLVTSDHTHSSIVSGDTTVSAVDGGTATITKTVPPTYGNMTVTFGSDYSITYMGDSYSGPDTIEFKGPYYNIDLSYNFWYPTTLADDPQDEFDPANYHVWCLYSMNGSDIPDHLMYETGPGYDISEWNSASPKLTLSTGAVTGSKPQASRSSTPNPSVVKTIATTDSVVTSVNTQRGNVSLDATNLYMDSTGAKSIAAAISESVGSVTAVNDIGPDPNTGVVWLQADDIYMGYESNDVLITTAIDGKQDVLEFDTLPTQGSSNPVTSGGVYDALDSIYIHGISSENGESSIWFDSNDMAVVSYTEGFSDATVTFYSGYSVSYDGVSYSVSEDTQKTFSKSPVSFVIGGIEYLFWLPTDVDLIQDDFDPFDDDPTNDYGVDWYFWCVPSLSPGGNAVPSNFTYKNGPSYAVSDWERPSPALNIVSGTETGDGPTVSRTNSIVTYPVATFADIPVPSVETPRMDDAESSSGTSRAYSRSDHVHPSDTSKISQGEYYRMSILDDGAVSINPHSGLYSSKNGIDPVGDSISVEIPSSQQNGGVYCSLISEKVLTDSSDNVITGSIDIFYYEAAPGGSVEKHSLYYADIRLTRTSQNEYSISVLEETVGDDYSGASFSLTNTYSYIGQGNGSVRYGSSDGGYFIIDCGPLTWTSGGQSPNTTIDMPSQKTLATTKYVDDAISGISGTVISVNGDSGVVVLDADDIMMGYDSNDITIAEAIGGLDDRIGDIDSVLDAINGEVI